MVHSSDHPPAHVHCYRGKKLIKVQLSNFAVLYREHASDSDVKAAVTIVREHHDDLLTAWSEIHGEEN